MKLAPFTLIAPVAAVALSLGLAGCGKNEAPAPQAAESGVGLAIAAGRLVLPAVAGNPGAAYFTLANGTAQPASLAAVTVAGATKAEMHETDGGSMTPITALNIGSESEVAFVPGGKHVMLFDLAKSLKPGDSAKITLTFAGGKQVVGSLTVEGPGGAEHH